MLARTPFGQKRGHAEFAALYATAGWRR